MEWVLILGISAVIIVIAVAVGQKRNQQLTDEGKVIKRDISFVESASTFTMTGADFAKIVTALKSMDISGTGASWESKGTTQTIVFKSNHGWAAQLNALESDGEKYRYRFQFTNWETQRGIPWRIDTMNMLLTAIEKAFLSIDPSTQVETTQFKTKTKNSFI